MRESGFHGEVASWLKESREPNQTVLYWLCGTKFFETMAVSLYHLRKHWGGKVVVACCPIVGLDNIEAAAKLCVMFGAKIRIIPEVKALYGSPIRQHRHYVTKSTLWRHVDGQVVYLDGDTVPVEPIDELFTDSITVTQFSDWVTTGPKISKRMRLFAAAAGMDPALMVVLNERWPAINTGIMAWGEKARLCHWLEDWEINCRTAHRAPLTDELALQHLLPFIFRSETNSGAKIADNSWNYSPTHGRGDKIKIWHFHGKRHYRREECRKIWGPLAAEAIAGTPGLREIWGKFNPGVGFVVEGGVVHLFPK